MPFRRAGNIYKCFYCHKTFNKASDLKDHTNAHIDEGLKYRTVKRCGIKFLASLDVTDLKCKLCQKEFDDLNTFLKHLQEEHNEKICFQATKHFECYKISDGDMNCLICGEIFEYFSNLLRHTLRLHRLCVATCEICGISFSAKNNLKKHVKNVHTQGKLFKCTYCEKKYTADIKRLTHEKRSHNVRSRTCDICGEVLESSFKKVKHLETVHNQLGNFKCDKCPQVFRLQNHLVRHTKRTHLKERNKVCTVCGDKFFDNQLLKYHMVRHSGEKPHECNICNKKFTRKKGLEMHVRTHTGDKRCVCRVCGSAFVQTASLKLHLRVHHGLEKNPDASND